MDKDFIISQLAMSKAQLEVAYLELQHHCQMLEKQLQECNSAKEVINEAVKEKGNEK